MARNGAGVYSKPSGTTPADGDDILSAPFNLLMNDIAADLNLPRPVVAGGTGASSAATGLAALGGAAKSANLSDLASAATARTNLGLVLQTNATDATAGRVLTVGAFGLGLVGTATTLANIDTTTTPSGVYRVTTGTTGTFPAGITAAAGAEITVARGTATQGWQMLQPDGTSKMYFRRLDTTWQPWQQFVAVLDSTIAGGDTIAQVGGFWARVAKGTAGQVYRQNDAETAPVWADPVPAGTSQPTTSGTAFDFLSIPAWATRLTVEFVGVSMTGTDNILVQVGTSGGVVTTSYSSASGTIDGGSTAADSSTSGLIVRVGGAADVVSGHMTISLEQPGTWTSSHTVSRGSAASAVSLGGGRITPGGSITRIRVTRTGTNTFDAGAVNIKWE